ncbi:MAG: hypothetical protein ACYSU0_05835 [Planctomycetota bacterium]|jgi:hypothetical protein
MHAGIAGTILSAVAASTCTAWFVAARAPMPIETAQVIFFAVAAPVWLVWLIGTWFALSRLRPSTPRELIPGGPDARDVLTGEAELTGDAEAVSKKIAEQLIAATSMGGMSGVKITERTRERVAFEKVKGGGHAGAAFDSGLVTLEAQGDKVRVRYAVSQKRIARTMRILTYLMCFAYGGIFVIGAPLLIWLFVVNSENANVRRQVWQTFQMLHGVWPPFLVGFLSGFTRKRTAGVVDTLLANLGHIV